MSSFLLRLLMPVLGMVVKVLVKKLTTDVIQDFEKKIIGSAMKITEDVIKKSPNVLDDELLPVVKQVKTSFNIDDE